MPVSQKAKAEFWAAFRQGLWEGCILIFGILLGMWGLANHILVWPIPGFD